MWALAIWERERQEFSRVGDRAGCRTVPLILGLSTPNEIEYANLVPNIAQPNTISS